VGPGPVFTIGALLSFFIIGSISFFGRNGWQQQPESQMRTDLISRPFYDILLIEKGASHQSESENSERNRSLQ
jgi:hypothetical protein